MEHQARLDAFPHTLTNNKLISAGQTAEILGLKESTLAQFRWRGDKRLPWVKLGKTIRYKLSDIEEFIERSTIGKGA